MKKLLTVIGEAILGEISDLRGSSANAAASSTHDRMR